MVKMCITMNKFTLIVFFLNQRLEVKKYFLEKKKKAGLTDGFLCLVW